MFKVVERMRRAELTGKLRQPYTPERGFGITHVDKPDYKNIWFVVPPAPPLDLPPGLPAGAIGKANSILHGRPCVAEASDLDKLTAYLFARREAVSSSRMEGTWSTIDNVLTPGEVHDEQEGKSGHLSVRGYAAALEYGFARVQRAGIEALTTELVCKLHELVMNRDPGFQGVAGRMRTPGLPGDVVQIGSLGRKEESIYNPAPPEYVSGCLDAVMAWMRDKTLIEMGDAGMGMTLPVRMAVGHAHFEAIHPFSDGNGRVGRILWPLQIAASGHLPLYVSGYIERNRTAYRHALEAAQKRLSYGAIAEYMADAIVASHTEEQTSKALIGGLPAVWEARGRFRKGSSALRALTVLMRMPILTARTLARELGVSFQAASSALNMLERHHIARERTGYGRNRVFAAEEVIAVLARPFGEDPEIALEGARRMLSVPGMR
ncbi:Fic family protein [Ferruginivarius sediminum]|uniref:Fic family protein n=1 Tax=Ferruginivarius sediminum TaxID=2661937 RepID=A0A369TG38_9PROT|nr:Fic family protein [Ferruginivarius sediminum]RDD63554.1 Fic family protein [Ferruginivarius sediminum]